MNVRYSNATTLTSCIESCKKQIEHIPEHNQTTDHKIARVKGSVFSGYGYLAQLNRDFAKLTQCLEKVPLEEFSKNKEEINKILSEMTIEKNHAEESYKHIGGWVRQLTSAVFNWIFSGRFESSGHLMKELVSQHESVIEMIQQKEKTNSQRITSKGPSLESMKQELFKIKGTPSKTTKKAEVTQDLWDLVAKGGLDDLKKEFSRLDKEKQEDFISLLNRSEKIENLSLAKALQEGSLTREKDHVDELEEVDLGIDDQKKNDLKDVLNEVPGSVTFLMKNSGFNELITTSSEKLSEKQKEVFFSVLGNNSQDKTSDHFEEFVMSLYHFCKELNIADDDESISSISSNLQQFIPKGLNYSAKSAVLKKIQEIIKSKRMDLEARKNFLDDVGFLINPKMTTEIFDVLEAFLHVNLSSEAISGLSISVGDNRERIYQKIGYKPEEGLVKFFHYIFDELTGERN